MIEIRLFNSIYKNIIDGEDSKDKINRLLSVKIVKTDVTKIINKKKFLIYTS